LVGIFDFTLDLYAETIRLPPTPVKFDPGWSVVQTSANDAMKALQRGLGIGIYQLDSGPGLHSTCDEPASAAVIRAQPPRQITVDKPTDLGQFRDRRFTGVIHSPRRNFPQPDFRPATLERWRRG